MSTGLVEWPAETIQATLFVHNRHTVPAANLFESAFGFPATTSHDTTNAQFGRLGTASTTIGGNIASLNLQPGRCDVALNSPHNAERFDGAGKIKDVVEGIELIERSARALVPHLSELARLAISVRFAVSAKTRAEANKSLLGVMPYKLTMTDEEDFSLQANWQATFGSYKINRLVRWSSESIVMSLEQIIPGLSTQVVNKEAIVAVVSLDFNTWPGHTKFSVEKSLDVITLLVAETLKARKNNLRLKS